MTGPRPAPRGSVAARTARLSPATSGRILVAAVAAGAVLPAVQALDTHTADAANTTTEIGAADLSLAAQSAQAQAPARKAPTVGHTVSPVSMPAATTGKRSTGSSSKDSDGGSAGDATDVASLTKAMTVARESGPPEFGTPYEAGNEKTLNGQISKALGLMGLPQKLAPGVKKIIMRESTGNADAVNDWDSNAAAGTPSKGLMQLIDTTFKNAVLPSLADKGIFDPVANITAGVRTMIANHDIEDVMAGGLKNSSGNYIGYGGAALPTDGLGLASKS